MNLRSLLYLVLWGVVAFLLIRSCLPESEPPPEVHRGFRAESFDDPAAPPPAPLYLENEFLKTKWSARGAACDRVYAKDYTRDGVEGAAAAGEENWLLLLNALHPRPPAPGEAPSHLHYRQRQGLRLWEPEGRLGVDLDAAEWQAGDPTPTADGGQELQFSLETPSGVRLVKKLRLRPGARHVELDLIVEPTAAVAAEVVGDLALRLGSGGGILRVPDTYYRNPYAGAARLDAGAIDGVETFYPSGKLTPRRDAAALWRGEIAFVVEGSKYFLSAVRPLESRPFRGAVAELLLDHAAFEQEIYEGFRREDRAAVEKIAQEDARVYAATGAPPVPAQLAAAAGLPEPEAASLHRAYLERRAAVQRGNYAGAWLRTAVAGDFSVHVGAAGSAAESRRFQWYLGPKDPQVLGSAEYQPFHAVIDHVDYGGSFFYRLFLTHWVAPAILWLLKLFHGLSGNWGIAIILLTLLVRGALFPLNRHSQVKMGAYQARVARLKPQIDAINKKYAGNVQRRQEETMKLYREHKMSPPVSGCLPILLQFPVFIGLFAALRCSILLRQQPFGAWIQDLSIPDALVDFGGPILNFWPLAGVTTLNVLPLIMVALWIWHQRSMPKPVDPQQAQVYKMMAFMPILFGVMLYNYAAGLSLYMITSSTVGIFEQKVIKKRWPVPVPGGAPPAKS